MQKLLNPCAYRVSGSQTQRLNRNHDRSTPHSNEADAEPSVDSRSQCLSAVYKSWTGKELSDNGLRNETEKVSDRTED